MRKGSKRIRESFQFENLTALREDPYYTVRLYCLPDLPGLWRRVPKGANEANGNPRILAYFDGTMIELMRDTTAEEELRQAGFVITRDMAGNGDELSEEEEYRDGWRMKDSSI